MRLPTKPFLMAVAVLLIVASCAINDGYHSDLATASGGKYSGYIKNGQTHGQGTLVYPDGGKYVGEFRENKFNGQGTSTPANGNKYVGEFLDDKFHGQGTYTFADGRKYVGEFRDNSARGQGTFTWPNGNKYVGEFLDDKIHGQGTYTLPDGRKYVGEFRDSKYHGQGTHTWPDGKKYVGEFKDNKTHGQGTLIHADGRTQEGVFENDEFKYARKTPSTVIAEKPKSREKPEQIAKRTKPERSPPPSSSGTSGSGFFVSKLGHVVTNQHVVAECKKITVGDNAKKQVQAEVIETDRRNDLALLKLSSMNMASAETKSLIRKLGIRIANRNVPLSSDGLLRSDDVELGEQVLVAGYPYGEIFSDTIKVTGGIVSAIRGMGDDSGQFQLDAAVQPGNSGGPIYDQKGNIVGVVVSQLNKLKVAKAIGSLPENVNFGIKASTVRQFLTSAGLPTKWSEQKKSISTKDLAKIAKNQTLMVVCHR